MVCDADTMVQLLVGHMNARNGFESVEKIHRETWKYFRTRRRRTAYVQWVPVSAPVKHILHRVAHTHWS